MEASEKTHSQLLQGPQPFEIPAENVLSDDLGWIDQLVRPGSAGADAVPAGPYDTLVAWMKKFGFGTKAAELREIHIALRMLGEGAALKAYGATLAESEKLQILGGQTVGSAGFAAEARQAKLYHRVYWHYRAVYDQMFGWRDGHRVGSLTQV